MKLDRMMDIIGDWNPQLLREFKGRFTGNSLSFILAGSILIQIVFCLWSIDDNVDNHKFYIGFKLFNWIIPIALMLGGIYTLITDINQEEKRGTFNFVKLSPQSGKNILLGKILGVPSLVYLAILSIVPLHVYLGISSGAGLGIILAWYSTIAITAYLLMSVTVIYVLYGGKYAILFSLLALQPISGLIGIYNFYLNATISQASWMDGARSWVSWFYLPISNNIWLFYSFISGTFLVVSYWLWETIERKYISLKATPFTKDRSYWINLNVQFWLLGFALPLMTTDRESALTPFYTVAIFYTISIILVVCLMPTILPNDRAMKDWASSAINIDRQYLHWWQNETIQDLMWHDRSPSILAIGINLAISAILWGLCAVVFVHNLELLIKFGIGITFATILTLIYTIFAHFLCLHSSVKNSGIIPIVCLVSLIPLLLGSLTLTNPVYKDLGYSLFLFSPFFWVGIAQLSLPGIGIILLGQLGILAGINKLFQQQLLKIGASIVR